MINASKNPATPTPRGDFDNNVNPPNNVHVAVNVHEHQDYIFYFNGAEFDRGTYKRAIADPNNGKFKHETDKRASDNAYVLKPQKGRGGILVVTNKKSYLYYPKLRDQVIVVEKTSDVPTTIGESK
ncbi:hypothetical protein KIM322_01260 [Lactobacillus xylocopicola]|uniref:Uncharacterized protein n=1 Tax=Lactobacillus xylocopicola TaxID=2976676 RepID=A0ABN6SHU7_9LACO|nr:hypothetical protein KIM322_01260 [Lactobacillus xylocopicola]